MSLRTKSLLYTLTSVVALLVAFSAVLRWVVVGGFKASEESSTARRVEELESLVGTVLTEFGQRFEDWSSWDAVSDFSATSDPEFVKENVSYDSLKVTLNVQFMAIVRSDGTVVLGAWCESDRPELGPLPKELQSEVVPGGLLAKGLAESGPAYDGVLMIAGKPYSVTSRPVLRTDKTKPAMAARFIVGRAMDGAWVERLERFSFTKLSLTPSKEQPAPESTSTQGRSALAQGARIAIVPQENEVHGFVALADLSGDPAVVLEVTRPRDLSHHSEATLNQSTATSAIAGLLLVEALA
jgi:sensor domain CHASE-containing protein